MDTANVISARDRKFRQLVRVYYLLLTERIRKSGKVLHAR